MPGRVELKLATRHQPADRDAAAGELRPLCAAGSASAGTTYGGTHGAIATDQAGSCMSARRAKPEFSCITQPAFCKKQSRPSFPKSIRSSTRAKTAKKYLYTTVQKGTPQENWLFVKMKTDGTVLQKITAPPEAGFKTPNEWRHHRRRPRARRQHLHRQWIRRLAHLPLRQARRLSRRVTAAKAQPTASSTAARPRRRHALRSALPARLRSRKPPPLPFRLRWKIRTHRHPTSRRPCQVSFHGDYALVSELEGRVTILDRDNVPVAFLGDNPAKAQWANYQLPL